MKKSLFVFLVLGLLLLACQEEMTGKDSGVLYVAVSSPVVIVSSQSHVSSYDIKYSLNHKKDRNWFFTGVYDIRNSDSLFIPNSSYFDTIQGDWFTVSKEEGKIKVYLHENLSGVTRSLRIQYAGSDISGDDFVIEQIS